MEYVSNLNNINHFFQVEFATLIEQLGNLHINELELKSMIRFFKASAKFKDRIWGLFIESLQRIASVSQGPDVYWNFPGYPDFVRIITFPRIYV